MKNPMCHCGCEGEATYLCSGVDFGGEVFVDEPTCYDATCYLEESAAEFGFVGFIKEIN